jgi:hypothetical protein
LFADDFNLILKCEDPKTLTKELVHVNDLFSAYKLLLNASKTKFIIFKSRKNRKDLTAPAVLLNGVELKQVTNEGFLGVQLDDTIKWYEHTTKAANSISKKIGMMSRVKNFVSQKTLKAICNCFVQPQLIYGITLWGRPFDKGLSRIHKLQKKAIRLLTRARRMDHSEPRLKQLGILKLEDLYKMHTICLTYDCFNREAPESLRELFKYTGSSEGASTRSQRTKPKDIKLTIPETNIGPVIKSSFISQAPLFWSDLPDSIQNSNSKDILRSRLKAHLLNQYSTVLLCKNVLCSDFDHCHHTDGLLTQAI